MKYKPWIGFSLLGIGFIAALASRYFKILDGNSAAIFYALLMFAVLIWATATTKIDKRGTQMNDDLDRHEFKSDDYTTPRTISRFYSDDGYYSPRQISQRKWRGRRKTFFFMTGFLAVIVGLLWLLINIGGGPN